MCKSTVSIGSSGKNTNLYTRIFIDYELKHSASTV